MGKYDAQNEWKSQNTTLINIRLNHNTDADLLEYLNKVPSKQGTIKQALRDYIARATNTGEK